MLTSTYLSRPSLGQSAAMSLRSDMVSYLGPVIGKDRAGGMFDKFMAAIKEEAGVGAKTTVMPMVVGTLVVSGLVAAVGIGLVVASKRKG